MEHLMQIALELKVLPIFVRVFFSFLDTIVFLMNPDSYPIV
ncbi:hypothetical protein [Flavobacterium laiguense]|nr:hypothetical protein [Flavobacterium laiguense]